MTEAKDPPTRKWKVLEQQVGEKWPIFTGDFQYLNEVLAEKPSNSAWLLVQYLNALCRSFGQVMFANNPISGAIIMLAIGIADYRALLAGLFTSTLSFIFALVSRQDSGAILNGGFGLNPVLHGVVSMAVLPTLYPQIDYFPPRFWLFLLVTTIMSVYVTSALNGLLKHIGHYPVPCFTLPFNLVQFILIYCLLHNTMPSHVVSHHLLQAKATLKLNETLDIQLLDLNNEPVHRNLTSDDWNASLEQLPPAPVTQTHLNWGQTFSGTIVAIAQVYGLSNVPCAALMYLALFVYSPIMAGFAYLGSLLGTLLGVLFASSQQEIYSGAWGYNGLLCAAALGGFCFVLNFQSTLVAIASVIFTTALQHFLNPVFVLMNLPILTMPFNFTTILFLFITTEKEESLSRPESLTFPENHRHLYRSMPERPQQGYLRRSQLYEDKDVV